MPSPLDGTLSQPAEQLAAVARRDRANAPDTNSGTNGEFNFGAPAAPGEVGTLGRYRVVKEIGRGGMGAVFLAYDTSLARTIALKVLLCACGTERKEKERFVREARAAAGIAHDNVVTVYETGECNGVPFIAMQFLEGSPLDAYLKAKGPLPLAHCVRIVYEAARGLAPAHARGLVHRDIKPGNLWLEAPKGRVKVLDFGLAKPVDDTKDLTESGAVMGTPAYMSPEQARGQPVDARADVYSLGAVLYQLLTGSKPFPGENKMEVLTAVLTDTPKPVNELNPRVPAALEALVHRMLAKKPEERPQSATEVAELLRAVLSQLIERERQPRATEERQPDPVSASQPQVVTPVSPTEPHPVEVPSDGARRGKLIAVLVVACVALAGVLFVAFRSPKPEEVAQGPNAQQPDVPAPEPGQEPERKPKENKPEPKGATPQNPKAGEEREIEIAPGTKVRFCYIPKGECQLGSPKAERDTAFVPLGKSAGPDSDEAEEKRGRCATNGFWMGKYEVTQAEWAAVLRGTGLETPSAFRTGARKQALGPITDTSRFPVESVSFHDCQEYLRRTNAYLKKLGDSGAFELPHEDEWEYACRGARGNQHPYYFGPALDGTQANCDGTRGPFRLAKEGVALMRPQPVGSYEAKFPHPWGLCDLHGNVWEWCRTSSEKPEVVARGGSWGFLAVHCRAAYRDWDKPDSRNDNFGFRLVYKSP